MNSSLHSMPEVRESAGLAFSTLYKSAGMQAIDEIVPTLLHALEDDETSDMALDGLQLYCLIFFPSWSIFPFLPSMHMHWEP
nr:protein ILITYHIA-like [Populus alba]